MSVSYQCHVEKVDSDHDNVPKTAYVRARLLRPHPRIYEPTPSPSGRVRHVLSLPVEVPGVEKQQNLVIATDYQSLLELGRQIVRALDPSPQDENLAEMKAIRKFLEDQKRS